MSVPKSVEEYLSTPIAEGSRNQKLFAAACQLRDCDMSHPDALALLSPKARQDGLKESEIETSLHSAYRGEKREAPVSANGSSPSTPRAIRATYTLAKSGDNGFERLLKTCFRFGEYVQLCKSVETEEGDRVLAGNGPCLTREDWLERLKVKPIRRQFGTRDGLWLRINPLRDTGGNAANNDDVTAYRHCLVEFDTGSKEEQQRWLESLNPPIAALIDSGNRSLHAWVRVDAKTREEYDQRCELIYRRLERFDPKVRGNRNPSRYSRVPGMPRGEDGFQDLLATNIGPGSWEEFERSALMPEGILPSQLSVFNVEEDPNNLIGNRWICRGGKILFVGQTGIGKSTLAMTVIIRWALGQAAIPSLHEDEKPLMPVRPLTTVVIQAENDIGDLAEQYQGVKASLELGPAREALLDKRVCFYSVTDKIGKEFLELAEKIVVEKNPDILVIDPLTAYFGGDISRNEQVAEFCYAGLSGLCERTGVVVALMHHTGKPQPNAERNASDLNYAGIGGSYLPNWARATVILEREGDHFPARFRMTFGKRGDKTGILDQFGHATDHAWLQHGQGEVAWNRIESSEARPPKKQTKKAKARYNTKKAKQFAPANQDRKDLKTWQTEVFCEMLQEWGITTAEMCLDYKQKKAIMVALSCSERTYYRIKSEIAQKMQKDAEKG